MAAAGHQAENHLTMQSRITKVNTLSLLREPLHPKMEEFTAQLVANLQTIYFKKYARTPWQ